MVDRGLLSREDFEHVIKGLCHTLEKEAQNTELAESFIPITAYYEILDIYGNIARIDVHVSVDISDMGVVQFIQFAVWVNFISSVIERLFEHYRRDWGQILVAVPLEMKYEGGDTFMLTFDVQDAGNIEKQGGSNG